MSTEYVIEKRVIVQARGLEVEGERCYVCRRALPDAVLSVRVSCRRCGSGWESRSVDVCGEECAEVYATAAELEGHHTIGEKGSTCALGRDGFTGCLGGCGRWVPAGQKCFECASKAVDEWIARSFGRPGRKSAKRARR